ncbi:MAG: Uncharacterized protein FD149_1207 [Rhodospirillaceae bacterium]|nr:MAG: Uncharacterized protein FD149_1207 [Rhodospirillaceae bacterium]
MNLLTRMGSGWRDSTFDSSERPQENTAERANPLSANTILPGEHDWLERQLKRRLPPDEWFMIGAPVGRRGRNEPGDVVKIQTILGNDGLWDLRRTDGPTGYIDQELEDGIRTFQRRNNLDVDGLIAPKGPTLATLRQRFGERFKDYTPPSWEHVVEHHQKLKRGEEGLLTYRAPRPTLRPIPGLPDLNVEEYSMNRRSADYLSRHSAHDGEHSKWMALDIIHLGPTGIARARDLVAQIAERDPQRAEGYAAGILDHLATDAQKHAFLGGDPPTPRPLGILAAEAPEEKTSANVVPTRTTSAQLKDAPQPDGTLLINIYPPRAPVEVQTSPTYEHSVPSSPPDYRRSTINQQDWDQFKQSVDKIPGLSVIDKGMLMNIYGAEGGSKKDPTSSAKGGILDETLRLAQFSRHVDSLEGVTKVADLTHDQMARVYLFYLDDTLRTVGGSGSLSNMDAHSASALADTLFRHGRAGGTGVIQQAINDVYRKTGQEPIAVDKQMGPVTMSAFARLIGSDVTRQELLDKLADRRLEATGGQERDRIDYHRLRGK